MCPPRRNPRLLTPRRDEEGPSIASRIRALLPNSVVIRARRALDEQIIHRTGVLPIEEHADHDVFIVGYPKSGNTWLQYLVAGLKFGLHPRLVPDRLVHLVVPDVHAVRYYQRISDEAIFKSHHLPRPDYRHVIHLVRDGRDVMVSYLHHLQAIRGPAIDPVEVISTGRGLFPSKWHEHLQAWRDNPFHASTILVKYERLLVDPLDEMRKICNFLQLERDDSWLRTVADAAAFDNMQQKESEEGWDNPNWPSDRPFVRRGRAGSFADELPPQLLELFMKEASEAIDNYRTL